MIDILRACLVLVLATDIPASDKGDGKPWGDAYISNRYKKIIEKAGITKNIGLGTLRHTYATLNLQHDDIENVRRTLGHSSIMRHSGEEAQSSTPAELLPVGSSVRVSST